MKNETKEMTAREMRSLGGKKVKELYGVEYFSKLSQGIGARLIAKYGPDYYKNIKKGVKFKK